MKNKSILCIILVISMFYLSACGAKTDNDTITITSGNETNSETVSGVNCSRILSAQTREELATELGCSLDELDDFIVYAKHMNEILPDTEEPVTTEFVRGVTEDGLPWITREEAKTFVSAAVVTTENWSEFFAPRLVERTMIEWDENDNEVEYTETVAEIDIIDGYYYDWTEFDLEMTNNLTDDNFTVDTSWPEEVEEEDGKFYCLSYDKDWNLSRAEYNPANYTCNKADGVVYTYNIPEEVMSVCYDGEYEDQTIYCKLTDCPEDIEYKDDDRFVVVVDDPDDVENTLCYVWISGFGDYVTER